MNRLASPDTEQAWIRPRRSWCLAAAVTLLMIAEPTFAEDEVGAAKPMAAKRPNVLVVMSDDHAYQAIGAYGGTMIPTPNLDQLAAAGTVFERAFVTNSICGPSRACMLTGKYSHLNGFYTNNQGVFNGAQPTFPKMLRSAGYQTAMLGKWHLVSDPTGFDEWEILIGQGTYYNPVFKTPTGNVRKEGYVTDLLGDRAVEWLGNRDRSKPFLLVWSHKAPHREWEPGPNELGLLRDRDLPEPDTLFDDYKGRGKAAAMNEMTIARHMSERDLKLVPPGNLTPGQLETWKAAYASENADYARRAAGMSDRDRTRWNYQRYIKDYLRCTAGVDRNLGRVTARLKELGDWDNTVVVYISDQGFYLGEHGWYDKRWMYEESFRTPLLLKMPGGKSGHRTKSFALNIDLAPTILDVCGLAVPKDMQGRSLAGLARGEEPADWRKSVYYHYYEWPQPHGVQPHFGVRTDRHKLIRFPQLNEWELYDLATDPKELTNLAGDPAQAGLMSELKRELERLRTEFGDRDQYDEPPRPAGKAAKKARKDSAKGQ
jgi:arylsulfatase A-like enzyme